MRLGFLELALILTIIIVIFGPRQIPKLTAVISDAAKKFKSEFKNDDTVVETKSTEGQHEE